ncbi:MAG TPA: cation-transporting P-type ATPase [Candidatus Paceibacterota bacterium]|nr:cation-transporting P-type ATPase [Candidatus Paceibacterota bacterium]HRS47712.1 cation-transporting P-type ATPase [Candidatus Paceibacterota bacterium]
MNMKIASRGLTSQEAQKLLKKFGPNEIFKSKKINFWSIFWEEVKEPMILLLLVVGFFYSWWGELEDALTILIVIVLLVLIEVFNEFRAKKAIFSLEKIAAPKTKVLRDSQIISIDSKEIVPGDILILSLGTKIAADAKLIRALDIEIDESALTGESNPVFKKEGDEIYAGTIVIKGEGEAKTIKTGKSTKMGEIVATLKTIKPPKTNLQIMMKDLAGKLVYVALFFSVLVPVIGIIRGNDIKEMILTGLSLSFAVIPEELPIIVTMVLGLGAYSLSKNNFLIKSVKSAEVLGSATVIVTDKTGTITTGDLKISNVFPLEKRQEVLEKAALTISPYSISKLEKAILDETGDKILENFEIYRQRNLTSETKTKAFILKNKDTILVVSGAPEKIFEKCKKIDKDLRLKLDEEAQNGKRLIAVAFKKLTVSQINKNFEDLEKNLDLVGLISFEDPIREGVKDTIATSKKAGIRTIMVTGDYPQTANYVAQQVGINNSIIVLGEEVEKMTAEELREIVKKVSIFARTTPNDKYRIVKALQENGEVVAVTGDGINDVLALKSADIGIAMGIKGTDVAREAAQIVLADDNYITITTGIFEGRKFFDNLTKGLKYYLAVKLALILIFLLPVILGIALPFSPIQIIVLELFMDLAASAGFVAEPKEKGIYNRKPIKSLKLLDKKTVVDIVFKGLMLFIAVIGVYFFSLANNLSIEISRTLAFSTWIISHVFLAFVSRSDRETIFSLGIFSNKVMNYWAILAIAFLIAATQIPVLATRFNMANIDFFLLIFPLLASLIILIPLIVKKHFDSNKNNMVLEGKAISGS